MGSTIAAGHWALDIATGILNLCPRSRKMFGLPPQVAQPIREEEWVPRIHSDDLAVVRQALHTSLIEGKIYAERFRAIHPDGSVREIFGVGRALGAHAGHGRFVGWNVDVAWSARLAGDWTWDLLNRDGESSPHSEANSFEEVQIPPLFAQVISDPDAETAAMLERAKAIMRMRKARVELLGGAMLGEPGFDLLLALYVLSAKQDSFSMTVLANAAGVPSASAWRWLAYLGDKGFITRCQSTSDRRAISIRLTEAGRKVFNEFLAFR